MLVFNSKENEQRWFTKVVSNEKEVIILEGDNVNFGAKDLWIRESETIQASSKPSPSKTKTFFVLKAWERGLSLKEKKIKKKTFNQKNP